MLEHYVLRCAESPGVAIENQTTSGDPHLHSVSQFYCEW